MKRTILAASVGALAMTVVGALLLTGTLRFNNPSRHQYPVLGIDVSHHQGRIDWAKVAAGGIRFAYIKATEGQTYFDPRFQANWNGCRNAGLDCGAYHYFTFCTPGLAQARHFLGSLDASVAQLPPVVDVEFKGNCTGHPSCAAIAAELRAFLEEVERAFGSKAVIYVAGSAHRKIVAPYFPDLAIWKRNIVFEPPGACSAWDFWQFSNRGRVDGIRGFVDLDVFCGPAEALPRAPI